MSERYTIHHGANGYATVSVGGRSVTLSPDDARAVAVELLGAAGDATAQESEPPIYVATAYRWGNYNGHHYVVGAYLDEDTAIQAAEAEVEDRGGKYDVEVVRWRGGEPEQVAYTPAYPSEGHTEPAVNERIVAAEDIGLTVFWEAEDSAGKEIPPWLAERVEAARTRAAVFVEHGGQVWRVSPDEERIRTLDAELTTATRQLVSIAAACAVTLGLDEAAEGDPVALVRRVLAERDEARGEVARLRGELAQRSDVHASWETATREELIEQVRWSGAALRAALDRNSELAATERTHRDRIEERDAMLREIRALAGAEMGCPVEAVRAMAERLAAALDEVERLREALKLERDRAEAYLSFRSFEAMDAGQDEIAQALADAADAIGNGEHEGITFEEVSHAG